MTLEEFGNTRFSQGMMASYKGDDHKIVALDFEEGLIALDVQYDMEPHWVRCENCKLIDNG